MDVTNSPDGRRPHCSSRYVDMAMDNAVRISKIVGALGCNASDSEAAHPKAHLGEIVGENRRVRTKVIL